MAREEGFTIVEVLVAALILVMGAFATFGVLRVAVIGTQQSKASQVAADRAQQEIEVLRSLSNQELALTATPPHSSEPLNPDNRVNGSEFPLTRSPIGNYKKLVENGGELYGGGFISGGSVNPGPTPFTTGNVEGDVYRYIVSEVQSDFIDPEDSSLNDPIPGAQGVNTAQQFFLSDTPCSSTGTTERQEITANHPLHNTLGTCASGPHTGSTLGAPDALLLGAPPDPAPEDPTNPSTFDYSSDYSGSPTTETAKGIQLRRDDTGGCHYVPAGTSAPQWQVHRWATDPMAAEFKMTEAVTIDVDTRALSDLSYKGKLCIYLFTRHETGSPPTAKDTFLLNKENGSEYWTVAGEGSGVWWRNEWHELRKTLKFNGPVTVAAGDRLGLALSVERTGTAEDALGILYDHPTYRSRIEVETTTPLTGE